MKKDDVEGVKSLLSDPKFNVNDKNKMLYLAMKRSNIEMVKLLILKGADLANQDETTKNTLLYDLIEKAASDDSNIDKFISIWQIVVHKTVDWWCEKHTLEKPNVGDENYKTYQRDALYYLRSKIPNKDKMSVIQLAATRGLFRVVREMIWVENVFVKQYDQRQVVGKYVNVTNLMPHLKGGENIKYKKDKQWVVYGDLAEKTNDTQNENVTNQMLCENQSQRGGGNQGASDECDGHTKNDSPRHCGCLLNTILEMEHSNKANEIFNFEPIKHLVRDYWFVHQWWTVAMLLTHLVYMALFVSYSLNNIYTIYAKK